MEIEPSVNAKKLLFTLCRIVEKVNKMIYEEINEVLRFSLKEILRYVKAKVGVGRTIDEKGEGIISL